jgi:Na+/melibiose symporter-like transporter
MKFRRDKDILRFSGIAVILIITGILMMSFLPGSTYQGIGFALIIMGVITLIIAIITAARPKEDLVQDERSERIKEKAGYHAFLILIVTMSLVQVISMFGRLNLDYRSVSTNLFLVGMWSWIILKWYYNRRGDVR